MEVVNGIVKNIRRKGLNHRQFRKFLEDMDSEYEDVPYYSEVRWLSRGRMMTCVYALREAIVEFYRAQGSDSDLDEFQDEQFINDFAFAVDIISHLNKLNTLLQGESKVISDLYHNVGQFHGMLELWHGQFMKEEINEELFPTLYGRRNMNLQMAKYTELVGKLKDEFEMRFSDFKKHSDEICLFTAPLSVSTIPARLTMEIIDLKHDLVYSPLFQPGCDIVKAYQSLPQRYSRLKDYAAHWLGMFGSTYRCEKLFSTMKYAKNKYRSRLTDDHLYDILIITDSEMEPDYKKMLENKDQHHKSH